MMKTRIPGIENLWFNNNTDSFLLIAGPCVIESEQLVMNVAERLCELSRKYRIPFVFKSSYRKANRSRGDSFKGLGDLEALKILEKVRKTFTVPVITDIHNPNEAGTAANYVDVLQIPAFLCRQTDLLEAAADLGSPPWRTFLKVTLPLSLPGVLAGFFIVFIPTLGEWVTPLLVGGVSGSMYGNVIQDQFVRALNWPVGSLMSLVMLAFVLLFLLLFSRIGRLSDLAGV